MADTMKAQVFYEPNDMKLEERPIPEIGDDEVLVRVKACGICGSDVAYYYGLSPLETETGKGPLVLGHEFCGDVAKVGAFAQALFKEGDRVVCDPVQYCNVCEICRKGQPNLCETKTVLGVSVDGGFAEYARVKASACVKLPDNVSYEHGALTEPLACSYYAVSNLDVHPGMSCVVFGPGPIGLMQLQLIKSSGAGLAVLVGTRDYRLEIGKRLGADAVFNTADPDSPYYCDDLKAKISELTDGKMADRALTSTGSTAAAEMALDVTGRRSVIVFFGLPGAEDKVAVPALDSILWDKTIRFSWLAPFTWPSALQALSAGLVNVEPLATHAFDLDGLVDALARVKAREDNVMKAVVKP